MEKMNDLRDLLKHEVQDLYSAEEQIIAALPTMIEKAKSPELKKSLQDHLRVTQQQRSRLEQVQNMLGNEEASEEKKGLLNRLFKSRQVCKGMQGLIEEGNKVLREEMHPDVLDAAIIACAQKIEHYEICGYGTARTFARELGNEEIARLLEQTLNEEYAADDLLTQLAITRINKKAENASGKQGEGRSRTAGARTGTGERIRNTEPEMEMASANRGSAAKKTAVAGRGGAAAPKAGEDSRSNIAPNRTAAASKRTTAADSKSGSKASGNASRSGSGGGRGTTGRSNSRGR